MGRYLRKKRIFLPTITSADLPCSFLAVLIFFFLQLVDFRFRVMRAPPRWIDLVYAYFRLLLCPQWAHLSQAAQPCCPTRALQPYRPVSTAASSALLTRRVVKRYSCVTNRGAAVWLSSFRKFSIDDKVRSCCMTHANTHLALACF